MDFPKIDRIMEYVPGDEDEVESDADKAKLSDEPRLNEPEAAGQKIILPLKDPHTGRKSESVSPRPTETEKRTTPSPRATTPRM